MKKSTTTKSVQSRPTLAFSGLLLVGLAYGVGSFAVNNGSLWFYFFTFTFIIFGIRLFVRSLKKQV